MAKSNFRRHVVTYANESVKTDLVASIIVEL